ncbi:MAG: efflux RND transporter periplasmic adaptor subunit [Melioribacteraceae bacterium]|nr:efflux RND transporter periplasmic adaptor subunit [Melioribacteraceae bacterium]
MKLKLKLLILLITVVSLFAISGCGEEESDASESMSDIQNNNGVPVAVEIVKPEYFKKELTFYSTLSGIMQTTRAAAVSGRVEKINFRVGDFVKEDDIVVQFPEDNPAVQYEQAKAAYDNSLKTYQRMKSLLTAGETSQANFDGAETKYLVDKRNYEMARQALFIDAPYDGIITEIKVNEGDGVDSKAALFTIAKMNRMKAKVWANEEEIRLIKKGMDSEINHLGKVYKGKVTHVSLSVDPRTRSFYAEVEFDNSSKELRPGTSVEIAIKIYENKEALIVPKHLIKQQNKKEYLFVSVDDSAKLQEVKTGQRNAIWVEILDGLNPGDKLIVKGSEMLVNGQKVNEVQ